MQKWEYLTFFTNFEKGFTRVRNVNGKELPNWKNGPYFIDYLNLLGEQGWEVIDSSWNEYVTQYLLKRPKEGSGE